MAKRKTTAKTATGGKGKAHLITGDMMEPAHLVNCSQDGPRVPSSQTAKMPDRVPRQPKGDKRATVGIVEELRQAIAKAETAGVSRASIAKAAGMSRAMLYRIADGRTLPRIDTAARLVSAIGFSLRIVPK